MRYSAPLAALAAALLAASPLHAQSAPECRRPEPRGSRAERRASADSLRAAREAAQVAMIEGITSAVRAAGVAEPKGIVVVDVDSAGKPYIHPLDINFPVEVLQSVAPRLLAQAASVPGVTLGCNGVYLRLDPLPLPTRARDRAEVRPRLKNVDELRAVMKSWDRHNRGAAGLTTVVEGYITREGYPAHPRVLDSSGVLAMDEAALAIFGMLRFHPASIGGVPVDVVVRLPITAGR
ncbi:MAG TPA: energy transducer TonB [Longimicrobium sp.]|nr:energy transducer TonB [Longimicrobium sp.]